MQDSVGALFLTDALAQFRQQKATAEAAMAQIDDTEFFTTLDQEANSVAILVKHLAGNMRSRWRAFRTTDGEKPDRQRDTEFMLTPDDTRAALMARWEAGWRDLFEAIEPLTPADLTAEVTIRQEPYTILAAINRQLTHYAYHVGQLVLLAKHMRGDEWQTLSIPRGESEAYNRTMMRKHRPD